MKLINNYGKPIVLNDGTILAAAGTNGSTKEVESISARDQRRYVDKGLVAIVAEDQIAKAKAPAKSAPKEEAK
jgi:hypothetical protein